MLLKYEYLEKQIGREHDHYSRQDLNQVAANTEPVKIGKWIYYRKADNPADSLSLYRFPVDELQPYGFTLGQVPYLRSLETF